METRFPAPLRPGDTVGVTSPSSGASGPLQRRVDVAVEAVRRRGYRVSVGGCMDGEGHVSAPAGERAAEFESMLLDPEIRAIVPPWGGDLAIDLIPLLDWEAIAAAEPTWVVGYSDMSTLLTPLTLVCGLATIHGNNLMDTPYRVPEGLRGWLDIVAMESGAAFTQRPPAHHRRDVVDYETHPGDADYVLDVPSAWRRLDDLSGDVDVTGRLVGGCIETLANLAGTVFADTSAMAALGDGLIVYVEAAGDDALTICRNLHGLRLNGFFDGAAAVLVGRTYAPDAPTMSQDEAVRDALGMIDVPILAGVDCGHWAPHLPLVNGALATVVHSGDRSAITQTLACPPTGTMVPVRVTVRVRPGASRTRVGGRWGDEEVLGVSVGARAVDGAATAAVCTAVAAAFGVRGRQVTLVSGERSRTKVLEVEVDADRGRHTLETLLAQN